MKDLLKEIDNLESWGELSADGADLLRKIGRPSVDEIAAIKDGNERRKAIAENLDLFLTREEIYRKDDKGRYVLSTAERQKALIEMKVRERE